MAASSPQSEVVRGAIEAFRFNKDLADRAISQVSDELLHEPLDPNTNSIAVIMKHVAGNLLSRFTDFLTADGEKPWRDRDQEFVDSFRDRNDLTDYWQRGWDCLFDMLGQLTADGIAKTITIRGEPHSVPLAISRSLAHCGYHIGQIVMIARIHAKDDWQTLTIARGESASFNNEVWDQSSYRKPDE